MSTTETGIVLLLAACGVWQVRNWLLAGLDKLNAYYRQKIERGSHEKAG
jgi:hypothetical protein